MCCYPFHACNRACVVRDYGSRSAPNTEVPGSDFNHFEIFFARPALGTRPIRRNVFPSRPRRDSRVRNPRCLVIDPATDETHPGFHRCVGRHRVKAKKPTLSASLGLTSKANSTAKINRLAGDHNVASQVPATHLPLPTLRYYISLMQQRVSTDRIGSSALALVELDGA